MGIIYLKDDQGRDLPFQIAGNQPTEAERQRILPYLSSGTKPAQPVEEDRPGNAVTRGLGSFIDQSQKGVAEMMIRQTDDPQAKSYWQKVIDDNAAQLAETGGEEGIFSQIGATLPQAAISAAPAVIGGMLGGPPGVVIGAGIGSLINTPAIYSGTLDRMAQEGVYDDRRAAVGTAGQVAVEMASDIALGGMARVLKVPIAALREAGGDKIAAQIARNALTRVGATAGKAGAVEGLEEAVQQGIERWAAELPLGDKEALSEYANAAAVGAGAGLIFGGGIGGINEYTASQQNKKIDQLRGDVLSESADLTARQAEANRLARQPYTDLENLIKEREAQLSLPAPRDIGAPLQINEDEYVRAVEAMRGRQKFSPNAISRALNVPKSTAQNIFNEMKTRGDATTTGTSNQYLQVTVGPSIQGLGSRIKREFKVEAIQNEDGSTNYGVYQVETVPDEKGNVTTRTKDLVDTYATPKLANARARQLDPNFSYDTNASAEKPSVDKDRQRIHDLFNQYMQSPQRDRKKFIDTLVALDQKQKQAPYDAKVQAEVDKVVGPGKLTGAAPWTINAGPDSLAEGVYDQPTIGGKPILQIARDLSRPNITPDEWWDTAESVTGHEIIHALRNADMVRKPEWDKLTQLAANKKVPGKRYTFLEWAAGRDPSQMDPAVIQEEAVAEMAKHYRRNPTAFKGQQTKSRLQKIIDRIKEFFTGLGQGVETLSDIFEGRLADRAEGSGGLGRGYVSHPFWSKVKVDPFYSNLDKIVSRIDMVSAKPTNWISKIKANDDFSPEEYKVIGLESWLKEQGDKKIPKEDIGVFIRQNSPKFTETATGVATPEIDRITKNGENDPAYPNVRKYKSDDYGEFIIQYDTDEEQWYSSHYGLPNIVSTVRFTTPVINDKKTVFIEEIQSDLHQLGARKGYKGQAAQDNTSEIQDIRQQLDVLQFGIGQAIRKSRELKDKIVSVPFGDAAAEILRSKASQHYFDPTADNNPERYISDWAARFDDDMIQTMREYVASLVRRHDLSEQYNRLHDRQIELDWTGPGEDRPPDFPLKDDWEKVAFKRILRWAAENDIDQVGWHGEPESVMQTEDWGDVDPDSPIVQRYLTKLPNFAKNYLSPWGVQPKKVDAREGIEADDWGYADTSEKGWDGAFPSRDDLRSFLANADEQIITKEQREGLEALEQAWYNRPNQLASYLAPQIAKLRDFNPDAMVANFERGTGAQGPDHLTWTVEITPSMKEDLLYKGQPRFGNRVRYSKVAKNPQVNTEEFARWFKNSVVVNPITDEPEVLYHATTKDFADEHALRNVIFDTDRGIGAHFGSVKAANHRFQNVVAERRKIFDPSQELRDIRQSIKDINGQIREDEARLSEMDPADPGRDQALRNIAELYDQRMKLREREREVDAQDLAATSEGANIMPVYLSLQNPIRLDDVGAWHDSFRVLGHIISVINRRGGHPQFDIDRAYDLLEEINNIEQFYEFSDYDEGFDWANATTLEHSPWTESQENKNFLREIKVLLQDAGIDGIEYVNAVEDPGHLSYIAFEPNQVKSATGNVGDFSPFTDDVRYSSVKRYSAAEYNAGAGFGNRVPPIPTDKLAEIEARTIHDAVTPKLKSFAKLLPEQWKQPYKEGINTTFIQLQDRMLSLAQIVDRIRQNGGAIATSDDPYVRATLMNGVIDEGIVNAKQNFYEPLHKAIQKLTITEDEIRALRGVDPVADEIIGRYQDNKLAVAELYLYAQHAKERNRAMAERNKRLRGSEKEAEIEREKWDGPRGQQYEFGSGLTNEEADRILNHINAARYARELSDLTNPNSIRSLMRGLIADTNRERFEAGLIPDFSIMNYDDGSPVDPYQDYVPLRGFLDENAEPDEVSQAFAKTTLGFKTMGKEDKSALGRRSLAAYTIEHAIKQNEEAYARAAKNRVAMSFINLVKQMPDEFNGIAEIIEELPIQAYLRASGAPGVKPTVAFRRQAEIRQRGNILVGKEDGKEILLRIDDERIRKALVDSPDLFRSQLGPVFKTLLNINRFLASVRTSYNPEFLISNGLRDLQQALINLSEFEQAGLRRKIVGDLYAASKGIWQGNAKEEFSTEWAQTYKEFRKHGGMTAFLGIRDLEDSIRQLNKQLSEEKPKFQTMRKAAKLIEDANIMVENAARLSTYKNLRDMFLEASGNPDDPANQKRAKDRAAFHARRLTVDFNAGGEQKNVANALYLFYNASLQGTMALMTPMARSKAVRKAWATIFAMGVAQELLNRFVSPEDDDGIKQYDKIPDWVLENNIVIMDVTGLSDRGYIKIPMPYLVNAAHNFGRNITKYIAGGQSFGEATSSIVRTIFETANPLGGAQSFANFAAPTIADPIIDIAINKDFTGSPIYKPENPYSDSETVDSQRYWNNTSPAAVTIADWLHRLTGGKGDYLPGLVEVTPETIEYWYQWLGGGAAATAQRMLEFGLPEAVGGKNILGDFVTGEEVHINDVPFARRFAGNITTREDTAKYFENREKYERIRKLVQQPIKEGDRAAYIDLAQKYKPEYRVALQLQKLERQRAKLNRAIAKINRSKTLTDRQKQEYIDDIKIQQSAIIAQANNIARGQ